MPSRMDYHKKNKQNTKLLIGGAAAVILIIILGVFGLQQAKSHNAAVNAANKKQAAFNKTHFNPNVTIYGVKVGKMTVASATKAINAKALNQVTDTDGKVTVSRNPKVETITQAQVQKYFDKQHTTLTNTQQYTYVNKDIDAGKQALNKVLAATVTYKVAGKSFKLDAKKYVTKASYYKGATHFEDVKKLTAKLEKMDSEVGTLGKKFKFKTPAGSTVTITNESYGWGIYVKSAEEAILQAYQDGKSTIDGKNHIYGKGYTTEGLGYGKTNNGLGHSYVAVSIASQDLWVVKNGKVVVSIPDVVTGTENSTTGDATPKGVWYIFYKQRGVTLRGTNDDGSAYASKVSYWMPFTLTGCGLHDASWRTDWSSTAYLDGGSHGCVNIRPSEIKSVWDAVDVHMPVVVF